MEERMMKAKASSVLIAFAVGTFSAQAKVNDQCILRWEQSLSAQMIGSQCRWMDTATRDKLIASQQASLACAVADATDAEKDDVTTLISESSRRIADSLRNVPCEAKAKQFYDGEVQKASAPTPTH
jgi:hypothetical protein